MSFGRRELSVGTIEWQEANFRHLTAKALAQAVLSNPGSYEWTLQGFGMLRTYLDHKKNWRLHVWDDRYRVAGVSDMHTHPWHFTSYVLAGIVENYRYAHARLAASQAPEPFMEQRLRCGVGGGLEGEPETTWLVKGERELYRESDVYKQKAHEIHVSVPRNGTVTLVRREFLDDTEHASVFWPINEEWVTAEPEAASRVVVKRICAEALNLWF